MAMTRGAESNGDVIGFNRYESSGMCLILKNFQFAGRLLLHSEAARVGMRDF